MVTVEKTRGVTKRVRFLPAILTSLGSKSGTSSYLICLKRVKTILRFLAKAPLSGEVSARPPKRAREAACAPQKLALPETACGSCLTDITDDGYNQ